MVFPGSGISDNLADKARTLGIPLSTSAKPTAGQHPWTKTVES
jgi:hypothetical protein